MCGIAGIIDRKEMVKLPFLEKMAEKISHRGPDGQDIWTSLDMTCGFVHARLAIIDVDNRSDQPFTSDDGYFTIVFNGMIYNFLELREELLSYGTIFRTNSDTEVLLHCFIVWGREMLSRLNGMWAFAIRDNRSGSIFISRDRFGIKPLYYSVDSGRLAFASEVRALLGIPWVDKAPNSAVMRRQIFDPMGIEASEFTLHQGVKRLPAGHWGIFADGKMAVHRWWKTVDHFPTHVPATLDQAAGEFRERFFDAVRLRMRSDVPIGSCVSGGFDSTAAVSAMRHIAEEKDLCNRIPQDWRRSFTATFEGHAHDETREAQLAIDYAGLDGHFCPLGSDGGTSSVETVLDALDDVYISLPTAPWKIYQAVKNAGVRVTIEGHGADEMMGGYFGHVGPVSLALRNMLSSNFFSRHVNLEDVARFAVLQKNSSYFLRDTIFSLPERMPIAAESDVLPPQFGNLDNRLYQMFHSSVLPTILRNFDRMSMAHGIEVRMPFMDWRLVTATLALPNHMKMSSSSTKLVAREAMAGLMPESTRTAIRKVGFNSQMIDWMNGSLGKWSEHVLSQPHDDFDNIVNRHALAARVTKLSTAKKWSWQSVGELWPYINLKWYLDRRCT